MSTKQEIYNEALRIVGDLRLTSLTEDVEARYALDDAWSRAVNFCAAQANWPHAYNTKAVALSADTSTPGYTKSYSTAASADWLRTVAVSLDAHFAVGAHYHEALGKIFLSTTAGTAYVRYIDKTYLSDTYIATWSEMFCNVVATRLAFEVCERLTQDPNKAEQIYKLLVESLALAKSQLALDTANMMIQPAQWAAKVHNDTVGQIWERALRLMGTSDPKIAMIQRPVDAKPIHQIMEQAWRGVATFCLSEGYWNFATKTTRYSASAGSGPGYPYSFNKPSDWLRTVAVADGTDGDFRTIINYRDQFGRWYANSSSIYVRYISSDNAVDTASSTWPDAFKNVLAARLAYECVDLVTGIPDKRALLEKEYATALGRALEQEASDGTLTIPRRRNTAIASIWAEAFRLMGYSETKKADAAKEVEPDAVYPVLDSAWERVVKYCLTEAYWNFATKTASIGNSGATTAGFSYGFDKPADWLRTAQVASDSIFSSMLEYRDQGGRFYANVSPIFVRYISSDNAADGTASTWPEGFARVVAYRLAYECAEVVTGDANKRQALLQEYAIALKSAAEKDAADQSLVIPRRRNATIASVWSEALRLMGYSEAKKASTETENTRETIYPVLDGAWTRVVKYCLTEAYWNFASETTSIASSGLTTPGYTYGFAKPDNWLRTIAIASDAAFSTNIEFRDQGARLYANNTPIYLRYISANAAQDAQSSTWPEAFLRVLAYRLAYECVEVVTGDPNKRQALLQEYALVLKSAAEKEASNQNLIIPKRRNATITAIWKEAARLIGYPETKKANPESEGNIESIYQIFDDAWIRVVKFCLTEAYWNFATVTAALTASGTPIPGWQYAFNKPASWLRTIAIANTERFSQEARYADESGKLYADSETIYIRYISSTPAADSSSSSWPEMFCRVLAYRLAYECSEAVTGDPNRTPLRFEEYKRMLSQAKNKDAMDQAQMFPKTSNWLSSMRGGGVRGGDRRYW